MSEGQAEQPVEGFGKWFNDWRGVFANEIQAAVVFREAIAAGAAADDSAAAPLADKTAFACSAWLGGTAEQTLIRPTAAGRWVVRVHGGDEEIMHVIDIDENRTHIFAVNHARLVRSVAWFMEVGGVEWVRPEAFPVPPSAELTD